MPVNGLPFGLEMLLDQLNKQDSLQSWQIYEQKNSAICVKLRYSGKPGHVADQSSVTAIERPCNANYKKVSEKQTLRNKSRAEQFQNNIRCKSDGITTRSKAKKEDDIEVPRGQDSPSTGVGAGAGDMLLINTPESVMCTGSPASHTSSTSPNTPELLVASKASADEENMDCEQFTSELSASSSITSVSNSNMKHQSVNQPKQTVKDPKYECHYVSNGRNHSAPQNLTNANHVRNIFVHFVTCHHIAMRNVLVDGK